MKVCPVSKKSVFGSKEEGVGSLFPALVGAGGIAVDILEFGRHVSLAELRRGRECDGEFALSPFLVVIRITPLAALLLVERRPKDRLVPRCFRCLPG